MANSVLLFTFSDQPLGGLEDYKGTFDSTLDALNHAALNHYYEFWQIVSVTTMLLIRSGNQFDLSNNLVDEQQIVIAELTKKQS